MSLPPPLAFGFLTGLKLLVKLHLLTRYFMHLVAISASEALTLSVQYLFQHSTCWTARCIQLGSLTGFRGQTHDIANTGIERLHRELVSCKRHPGSMPKSSCPGSFQYVPRLSIFA